eukprot:543577-Amphidinium_carterae.2
MCSIAHVLGKLVSGEQAIVIRVHLTKQVAQCLVQPYDLRQARLIDKTGSNTATIQLTSLAKCCTLRVRLAICLQLGNDGLL